LKELNLSNTNVGPVGAVAMVEALKESAWLQKLDLSNNQSIGDQGALAIANALLKQKTATTAHQVNDNSNLSNEKAVVASSFLQKLKDFRENPSLQELRLPPNSLGDFEAMVIADVLKVNTSLELLDLSSNNIAFIGAVKIGEALSVNTGLRCLALSANKIGESGAMAIAEGLKNNSTLDTLLLNENNIGNDGAKA